MIKVGIIGATGYAGQQLLWILKNHKKLKVEFISSHSFSGNDIGDIYKNYKRDSNNPPNFGFHFHFSTIQAFSHLSRVSTYIPEIFPPSMGSMSPKAGLIGWRVYSILPVSGFFLRTSFLSVTPRSSWY